MTYDHAGQLQTLTPASGTATDYGFDGVGNRTTVSTTAAGSASYSYSGDGLRAASTDVDGSHAFAWDTLTASLPLLLTDGTDDYVYGPNHKDFEQDNIADDTTAFLHQDRAGSTRLITDNAGAVVGTTSYDPYGTLARRTGTAASQFGYDGEYTDPTGLIYLRARYYDPATGQFLTVDPLEPLTHESYGYAGGDPINRVDPSGERFIETPDGNPYGYADSGGDQPSTTPSANAAEREDVIRKAASGDNASGSRGSTGRAPANLHEQLALKSAQSDPGAGKQLAMRDPMRDSRWSATDGWVKMAQNVNGVEIHYVYNTKTHATDDWKIVDPRPNPAAGLDKVTAEPDAGAGDTQGVGDGGGDGGGVGEGLIGGLGLLTLTVPISCANLPKFMHPKCDQQAT
jgi:RHS repeat-associated protein